MKIGIFVHSQTGNTYAVAQKLGDKLIGYGHSVDIKRILPVDEKQIIPEKIQLTDIPDIDKYDALVFGGPVRGFSISPVLAAYFSNIASLQNKKVALLVTELFPFPIMGGNQAIARMKVCCEAKGATVCGTGIVNWSSRCREKMITELIDKFCNLF